MKWTVKAITGIYDEYTKTELLYPSCGFKLNPRLLPLIQFIRLMLLLFMNFCKFIVVHSSILFCIIALRIIAVRIIAHIAMTFIIDSVNYFRTRKRNHNFYSEEKAREKNLFVSSEAIL